MDLSKNKKAFLKLKNINKKPKAIIFDWDNTLVDTWPIIQQSIDGTLIAMNKEPWGLEKVRNNVHRSMRESFSEIFGNDWQKAGEIYQNTYRSLHLKELYFLPNALKLINHIAQKGILQFVVSNKIGSTLRREASNLKVDDKFFALIGSMDASSDKPSKEPVDIALMGSDLDLKKDEIWFIGDTITDIDCAYNSSCQPIAYGHPAHLVSNTIPKEILINGKNNEGALPLYFDHQELIDIL